MRILVYGRERGGQGGLCLARSMGDWPAGSLVDIILSYPTEYCLTQRPRASARSWALGGGLKRLVSQRLRIAIIFGGQKMPADPMKGVKNNPAKRLDICLRRADFLIREARSFSPEYDHAVVYSLRVISNWISVGGNFGSREIRWRNKRISKKAWNLYYASLSDVEWLAGTINEHPEPLSAVWAWICENCAEPSPE